MNKVILVTDVNFWQMGAGHRVRIAALIAHLADHTHLTVAFIGMVPPDQLPRFTDSTFAFVVLNNQQLLNPAAYGELLENYLRDKEFTTIIIEYIHLSYLLNFVDENVQMVLDAHDIVSERSAEFKKFNYGGAIYEMSAETECEIFDVYDYVMILGKPDYDHLQKIIAGKVLLCPHPVVIHPPVLKSRACCIGYIASEYLPNVDAIEHFINNCWDDVSDAGDVTLHIYGNVCRMLKAPANERIILKGYSPDLQQIYAEVDIIINPVRFGAGMKIKNIEALANGIPLLTTLHGARGLDGLSDNGFLTAANDRDFIRKLRLLITDAQLRERLSYNAMKYMGANYSAQKCFAPLLNAIYSRTKTMGFITRAGTSDE